MGETALKNEFITEEDYLAGEELTEEKNEYIDGCVYAMANPTDTHGIISLNLASVLPMLLRGQKCRTWMGNMRVRFAFPRVMHYLPDVMVACDDPTRDTKFREQPLAIWEVFSPSSEAIDTREKRHAYITLPTLRHYFMVRQDRVQVTHLRRSGPGWEELVFLQPDQEIEVSEIGFRISLADVYAESGV